MNMIAECGMVWSCREIVIQLSVAVIKKETGTLKKEGRFTLSCGSNSWLLTLHHSIYKAYLNITLGTVR